MKTKITLSIAIVVTLAGCSSMPGIIQALAQDHNNVTVQVTTIYGSLRYARTGATNAAATSDGSITPK